MASINDHGAHDAMADIEATKKCYFELIRREIITDYQYIEPERKTTIITQPIEKTIKQPKKQSTMKIIESGKCGDNVSYELTEDGVLNIFGSGKMDNWDGLGNSPFQKNINIKRVIIDKGVTSIGDKAFDGCTSLVLIDIPNSVTEIGWHAFYGCTSLESINIPNSVTEIGSSAFKGCTSLNSIDIPNSVLSIAGGAFDNTVWFNNQSDGVIYINDKFLYRYKGVMPANTHIQVKEGITQICSLAFERCTSLESIDIPNSVTKIGRLAFYGCTSLNSIDIPNSVTEIGRLAFYGCKSLNSIDIPNSVTEIGLSAFKGCTSLNSIDIPNSVTEIGSFAFKECTSLKSIDIPNSVTEIGRSAFEGCTSLNSIDIPNSVLSIAGGAFDNTVWFNNQSDGVIYINDKFLYRYKGVMPANTHIQVKEGITQICGGAFRGCTSLNSIDIPNSVTEIGRSAFCGCTSLNSIDIPNSVTEIGSFAFTDCTSLELINILNSVTEIGWNAFWGCTSLESINIPNSVTKIGWFAFDGCISLKSIDIPNSVTEIGGSAFEGCISLKSIDIPNSVTEISESTFEECTSLKSIDIPNSVTEIGRSAFNGCTSLKMINIPSKCSFCCCKNFIGRECVISSATEPFSIKCKGKECSSYEEINFLMSIYVPKGSKKAYQAHEEWGKFNNIKEIDGQCGDNSYYELLENGTLNIFGKGEMYDDFVFDKSKIKKVVVTEYVSMIGANAFKDCRKLRIVEIESPLEEIADGAFAGCENVISIIVKSDLPPIVGSNTFEGVESSVEIVVPALAMRYYKAAKGWNKFTNYVAIDLC